METHEKNMNHIVITLTMIESLLPRTGHKCEVALPQHQRKGVSIAMAIALPDNAQTRVKEDDIDGRVLYHCLLRAEVFQVRVVAVHHPEHKPASFCLLQNKCHIHGHVITNTIRKNLSRRLNSCKLQFIL